jgi:hypothetical protein
VARWHTVALQLGGHFCRAALDCLDGEARVARRIPGLSLSGTRRSLHIQKSLEATVDQVWAINPNAQRETQAPHHFCPGSFCHPNAGSSTLDLVYDDAPATRPWAPRAKLACLSFGDPGSLTVRRAIWPVIHRASAKKAPWSPSGDSGPTDGHS